MKKTYQKFQSIIWDFYEKEARKKLPWRQTKNPYKIWVSEIMLQQTQVTRVIEKYKSFLAKFPTLESLAQASQGQVLKEWVGLGYNRRALFLKKGAEFVVKDLKGKFPKEVVELQKIPGIGHYTARAVATFAYNKKHSFVETNIRTVFLHEFFSDTDLVCDKEILKLVEQTLDTDNPRHWYYALMDYGVYLKRELKINNKKSKQYTRQSKFIGSRRQVRGTIIRILSKTQKISQEDLFFLLDQELPNNNNSFETILQELVHEKLVFQDEQKVFL